MELQRHITDEKTGISYTLQGDYYLPDLKLPEQEEVEIGIWGERYRRWLQSEHKVLFYNLLTKGTLMKHLAEVDERANDLIESLIAEMAKSEGVTEKLKADDMMAWVGKMNNIRNRANEIVREEIFCL